MTPEDYFTNAVRMYLADGGTPKSAHRLIDETATEPARAKPSREEVAGAQPSPATSEEIARAMGMAIKPAGAKPSREEVEGAQPSPANSEEIARAIREALETHHKLGPLGHGQKSESAGREARSEEDWDR